MASLPQAMRLLPFINQAGLLQRLQATAALGSSAALRSLATSTGVQKTQYDRASGDSAWSARGLLSGAAALAAGTASTSMVLADAGKVNPEVPKDPYARPTDGLRGPPKDITLYQYEVCPFCCKVKAMLDYYKLPYRVVEVNPLTKGELKWSSYRKVPVLTLGESEACKGEVLVDSSAIMSRLAAELAAGQQQHDSGKVVSGSAGRGGFFGLGSSSSSSSGRVGMSEAEEVEFRKWVDARLVKVITANIYRSWDETWNTFKYITEQTTWAWGTREAARMTGAVLMWQIGKRMPAKYNIEGDLREALYSDLNRLVDLLKGQPFLGGAHPNLADLSAFGVLRAVESTPTFADAMAHSKIKGWYDRMVAAVGPSACTNPSARPFKPKAPAATA